MGMDFVALIRYPGYKAVESAVCQIEADELAALRQVAEDGRRLGFTFPDAGMGSWDEDGVDIPVRPAHPSVRNSMWLNSGFSLTFGTDAVRVYHVSRWLTFLTDSEWQRVMLTAVRALCSSFQALDCAITSDYHPADSAFVDGASFAESLAVGGPEDGEVPTLADLYQQWVPEEDADSIFKPTRDGDFRQIWWDRERPIPDGWELVTTWDSKGYWRFDWR